MDELVLAYSPPPGPALDSILALDEDSLPWTDDQPLPDVRAQEGPLTYSRDGIRRYLRHMRDHVAVDSDMFVYYIGRGQDGQPDRAVVAPDVFVVFGVPDRLDRKCYVLWREADAEIRFVLEIASVSTRRRDHTVKRDVYASLGVWEYFLYDPPEPHRPARLTGLRLRDNSYREIACEVLPHDQRGIRSEVVGLVAHVDEDGKLRWFDPLAGVDLLTYDESMDRLEAAKLRMQTARSLEVEAQARRQEVAARKRAEARIAELEAQLHELDQIP